MVWFSNNFCILNLTQHKTSCSCWIRRWCQRNRLERFKSTWVNFPRSKYWYHKWYDCSIGFMTDQQICDAEFHYSTTSWTCHINTWSPRMSPNVRLDELAHLIFIYWPECFGGELFNLQWNLSSYSKQVLEYDIVIVILRLWSQSLKFPCEITLICFCFWNYGSELNSFAADLSSRSWYYSLMAWSARNKGQKTGAVQ